LKESAAMGAGAVHLEAEGHVCEFYRRNGFTPRGRDMMTRWIR